MQKLANRSRIRYELRTHGVLDLAPFQKLQLRGGFTIEEVRLTAEPLLDPIERAATAQTIIRGDRFQIFLRADLDERELSVSLYHEVLEAATVAAETAPEGWLNSMKATSKEKHSVRMIRSG